MGYTEIKIRHSSYPSQPDGEGRHRKLINIKCNCAIEGWLGAADPAWVIRDGFPEERCSPRQGREEKSIQGMNINHRASGCQEGSRGSGN